MSNGIKVKRYYNKSLDKLFYYDNEYLYACRYLGLLIHDAHFAFPDDGMLNREGAFTKDDVVFPLWVQTWKDGTVYNVKDYTGTIPRYAQIISVNGYSAQDIALRSRSIAPGEQAYAMSHMNLRYEASPRSWPNFQNYLFASRINGNYKVTFKPLNSDQTETITLSGITRGEKVKQFKRSGDKRKSKQECGFPRSPVAYTNKGEGIGVLSINSFWGKRWSAMLLFGKDWRYKRMIKQAMKRIHKDDIQNLIIDISLNTGGMTENIYYTLNYFTDKPIDLSYTYLITDNNRELAKTNVSRSPEIPENDREFLIEYIDTIESGSLFYTDSLRSIRYIPTNPKYRFKGNVYVLTSNETYSAAQIFARQCRKLNIGLVAGEHCGGYNAVTGNAAKVQLPSWVFLEFKVPFSMTNVCEEDDPYGYPSVDIPIERPFDEWLKRENRNLERLIETIHVRNNDI